MMKLQIKVARSILLLATVITFANLSLISCDGKLTTAPPFEQKIENLKLDFYTVDSAGRVINLRQPNPGPGRDETGHYYAKSYGLFGNGDWRDMNNIPASLDVIIQRGYDLAIYYDNGDYDRVVWPVKITADENQSSTWIRELNSDTTGNSFLFILDQNPSNQYQIVAITDDLPNAYLLPHVSDLPNYGLKIWSVENGQFDATDQGLSNMTHDRIVSAGDEPTAIYVDDDGLIVFCLSAEADGYLQMSEDIMVQIYSCEMLQQNGQPTRRFFNPRDPVLLTHQMLRSPNVRQPVCRIESNSNITLQPDRSSPIRGHIKL